jgi:type II secretory pathway pseudopilin PulG
MRSITPNPRGMALIMAMIVVVLITMLVAGAISFTGTELAAAEVQTQESSMSACIQAARNLFLSKLKRVMQEEQVNEGGNIVRYLPINFDDDFRGTQLKTGHMGGLTGLSARRAGALTDQLKSVGLDNNTTKKSGGAQFYTVTAVCRDTRGFDDPTDPRAPEREIEFMVRVGL